MKLDWNKPGLNQPLTERQIKKLKNMLQEYASQSNCMSLHLTPSQHDWVKENVTNMFMKVVMDPNFEDTGGYYWVIIGADEETCMAYYNTI